MIIDLLFTAGAAGFLLSDIKQFHKLHTQACTTSAISRTHLKIKLTSLVCVFTGYMLSSLHISAGVAVSQFVLNLGILYYTLRRYE